MRRSVPKRWLHPGWTPRLCWEHRTTATSALQCAAFACLLSLLPCLSSSAATLLVWPDSPNPTPPYASWATAAQTIQAAVDAAQAGDTVLVTNGVYATGGRAAYGLMTNRLAVDRPIVVQSINGPQVTVIQGCQVPGTTNGDGATRCVYLTNGAVLNGFTVTNGATRVLGDASREQSGGGVWCESISAVVTNCVLLGNAAYYSGGGAYSGTLNNCTIAGNSAQYGGGVDAGGGLAADTLNDCTIAGNSAQYGGGTHSGTLKNCALKGNSAIGRYANGGGALSGWLENCIITGNSATGESAAGGGAFTASLYNCAITGNSAESGGGVLGGWLENCTVTGNSARRGGGASGGQMVNCVLYYNTAIGGPNSGPNYDNNSALSYSCTTPLPGGGIGNISSEPQLATASHLSANSPCRGAGSAAYLSSVDIDGEAWLRPPSIGCDEYRTGAVTGAVTVAIGAAWTDVAEGFAVELTAQITGRVATSVWDFGDGTVLSNRPYASHFWWLPGVYSVVLSAYNESHKEGVSATTSVRVLQQTVHYVSVASTNPLPPFSSWATAAQTIQDGVDAAEPGALVMVTNGVYAIGGRAVYGTMTNRVAVQRPVVVVSVNGPEFTVIQGYQVPGMTNGDNAIRCVYLTNGAMLGGFTLSNGATRVAGDSYLEQTGGGLWCESQEAVVTNCKLTGNSAVAGGGISSGTANNCVLAGNSAQLGGGAYLATLDNCTLSGNSASASGGGAFYATLNNCILFYNTANIASNYDTSSAPSYCCTVPMPINAVGNITTDPLFVDRLTGNLRLQSNSPCINAGLNAYARGPMDLDGRSRIVRGTVDIGAYEYQGTGSILPYAWLQQYNLPTDGTADYADPDHDGLNTWQEWICGTDPTNALSVLRLLPLASTPPGLTVSWHSVTNRAYLLERSTNLAASPAFLPLATGIPGQPGTTTYTDTNAPTSGTSFYRISTQR